MKLFRLRRLTAVLLPCLLFFGGASGALAHAVLLSSSPAEKALLAEAPETFVLTFNEPVSLLTATLFAPDGTRFELSGPSGRAAELPFVLPAGLERGTHVLSWRVVSLDGHPVGGTSVFSIGATTATPDVRKPVDRRASALLWGSRLLLYGALFFGLGTAVFKGLLVEVPASGTRFSAGLLAAALVVAAISPALQGADALALGISEAFSIRAWVTGLATSYGRTLSITFLSLLLAVASLRVTTRSLAAGLAVAAWMTASLAFTLSGHASAADPRWLTRPAIFLHVAAVVFWVGSLLSLSILLRQPPAFWVRPLTVFSAVAPIVVGALLLSGVLLAVVQLGLETAPWLSSYGVILAGKLLAVAVLLALAAWNRFFLTRPAVAGEAKAGRRLGTMVGVEMALMVIILGLVAGWRFTPPPRALAEAAAVPLSLHIHTAEAMADIVIEPGHRGLNSFSIALLDSAFAPIEPLEVNLVLSAPEHDIEAIGMPARLGEDGRWLVTDLPLLVAGEWQLDLEVRLSRFELVRLRHHLAIP